MKEKLAPLTTLVQLLDEQLTTDQQAKWGLMNAQQMTEHLSLLFILSTGKWGDRMNLTEEKAAKAKQNFWAVKYPFPKNVLMPKSDSTKQATPPLRCKNLEESKTLLNKSYQKFIHHFESQPKARTVHPFFGALSWEEWIYFHTKHFEHHLMQFDLIPYPLTPEMEGYLRQIQERLDIVYKELSNEHTAQWGMMNAHQCVEHLGFVFIYSTGKFGIPFKGDEAAAKNMWEPFTQAEMPWKTVFPDKKFTKEPPKLRAATIEASKKLLKKAFTKYTHYCKENPNAITPHGFLGNISTKQWLQVHVKHIKYHLAQFGISVEAIV